MHEAHLSAAEDGQQAQNAGGLGKAVRELCQSQAAPVAHRPLRRQQGLHAAAQHPQTGALQGRAGRRCSWQACWAAVSLGPGQGSAWRKSTSLGGSHRCSSWVEPARYCRPRSATHRAARPMAGALRCQRPTAACAVGAENSTAASSRRAQPFKVTGCAVSSSANTCRWPLISKLAEKPAMLPAAQGAMARDAFIPICLSSTDVLRAHQCSDSLGPGCDRGRHQA